MVDKNVFNHTKCSLKTNTRQVPEMHCEVKRLVNQFLYTLHTAHVKLYCCQHSNSRQSVSTDWLKPIRLESGRYVHMKVMFTST